MGVFLKKILVKSKKLQEIFCNDKDNIVKGTVFMRKVNPPTKYYTNFFMYSGRNFICNCKENVLKGTVLVRIVKIVS